MNTIKVAELLVESRADTTELKALERALEGVRLASEGVRDRIGRLDAAWREGAITVDAYQAQYNKLNGQLQEFEAKEAGLKAQLDAATASMREATQTTQAMASASGAAATAAGRYSGSARTAEQASARTGQRVTQLAYALDDIQYGLRGVSNNLIQAAVQFGPWGAAVGAAFAGGVLLYNNIENINEALGIGSVKTEAERMEELGRKTHKTADETAEFNRLKREQNEIEELLARRSGEQTKTKAAVEEAIGESGERGMTGGERLRKGLVEARATERAKGGGEAFPLLPEEKERIATLQSRLALAKKFGLDIGGRQTKIAEDAIKKIRDEARDREIKRAEADIQAATESPEGLQALTREVERHPGSFAPGTAERLRAATPEGREKAAKEKEEEKEFEKEEIGRTERTGKAAGRGIRKATRENRRAVEEEARGFAPGIGDDVATLLAQGIVGGIDPAAVVAHVREEIARRLRAGGVAPENVEAEADHLAAEMDRDFQRRMAAAGAGRAGVTREQAARRVIAGTKEAREAARGETREEREAEREREHAVSGRVRQFRPAFDDALRQAMGRHERAGRAPEESDAALAAQVEQKIRELVPEAIRSEVARKLVEEQRRRFEAKEAERDLARPPAPARPGFPSVGLGPPAARDRPGEAAAGRGADMQEADRLGAALARNAESAARLAEATDRLAGHMASLDRMTGMGGALPGFQD